ncbi:MULTISPECIES: site-specific integrase [unclassified Aminobacter]|uniref:tyrosine-type recombinase/integrase n=1 Tax=unclassified Aminobacter TaxID=2644704 RepID=UPI0004648B73|nr:MULTISPECIES: site-specific integrase [unclassified Aminobacter]TWH35617.1 site-specific recombinase XerD [Aminobacter sp. J15]
MARPRGNKWQADFFIDGKRRRLTFNTKEEAERYERAIAEGYRPEPNTTIGTYFVENFDRIWKSSKAPKYIKSNFNVIFQYIPKDTPLDSINRVTVEDMIYRMVVDGKAGGTINRKLSNLNVLLKDAFTRKVIPELPCGWEKADEGEGRERVLTLEEERKCILWFDQTCQIAYKHLFVFMLYTGCRIGEALTLDRKHVSDGYATFVRTKTKNKKTRVIPLPPKAKEAWEAICRMSNAPMPFGDKVTYRTFMERWHQLKEHLGVEDDNEFVPHMLRHTCATRLCAAGVPLMHIAQWLGHSSTKVTHRYITLVPKHLDVALQALS